MDALRFRETAIDVCGLIRTWLALNLGNTIPWHSFPASRSLFCTFFRHWGGLRDIFWAQHRCRLRLTVMMDAAAAGYRQGPNRIDLTKYANGEYILYDSYSENDPSGNTKLFDQSLAKMKDPHYLSNTCLTVLSYCDRTGAVPGLLRRSCSQEFASFVAALAKFHGSNSGRSLVTQSCTTVVCLVSTQWTSPPRPNLRELQDLHSTRRTCSSSYPPLLGEQTVLTPGIRCTHYYH